MKAKYYDLLAKVKADDAFKKNLIEILEEKQKHMTIRRFFSMKQKKWAATVAAAVAMLACTGTAIAFFQVGFGAKDFGVQFADDYSQYVELAGSQVLGNDISIAPGSDAEKLDLQTNSDGVKVALESYLCDEGFLDVQFRVKISAEKLNAFRGEENSEWEEPLTYLSFNDPVIERNGVKSVQLGGANYTLNIDGKDVWLRGRTAQDVEKIGAGEYVIQQMWFLGEDVLGNKDDFRISLNDVAVGLGETCISLDGSFELPVSKTKAAAATKIIELQGNSWSPRAGVTKTVETISQTPLQTIFRIRSVYTGVSSEQLDIDSWDYLVYDSEGEARATYSARTAAKITYADGIVEQLNDPGEYDFGRKSFEGAAFVTEEIIATAPVQGSIVLRAYDADYAPDYRVIVPAEYQIDLSAKTMAAKTVGTVIYDAGTGKMDSEYGEFCKLRYGQDVAEPSPLLDDWNKLMNAHKNEFVSVLD